MLAELMEKYKVVNSVGNNIGKVKDIFIDLSTWEITGFEISPGRLKKDFILGTDDIVKIDEKDQIIIVGDEFQEGEKPERPTKNMYPFEELKKHNVVDNDNEKMGRIYNLEIPFEKLKVFKVWKILIKTGFKERRLRLPTSEVDRVMDDINLKGSLDEYMEEKE